MAGVEQTPEKKLKRGLHETRIISPSREKRSNNSLNTKDDNRGDENKRFDIIVESSVSSSTEEKTVIGDVNVKCLEIVFPNSDRCGVNVSLLQTTGEFLAECMQAVSPRYNIKLSTDMNLCLVSEEDERVDTMKLTKDLDFESTYYIKAC